MPRVTVLAYPALSDEPVSLAMLKAQVRVDGDAEDALLTLKLQAARDACEGYCGRFFAPCTVAATYEVGEPYALDPLAGEPTGVTGFYTDLTDLAKLTDTGYQAEYLKGITVNRDYPIGGYGGYLSRTDLPPPSFTVTYPVAVTPEQVPPAVKEAILKLAAELYENRESSAIGRETLLAVNHKVLLSPYCLTNPFYRN